MFFSKPAFFVRVLASKHTIVIMWVLVSKHTLGFMTGERVSTLDPCCPCCAAWYENCSRTPGFPAGAGSTSPVKVCHCLEKSVTKTVESALGAASAAKPSK